MNFTHPYITHPDTVNFTLDPAPIVFETPLSNTYFELIALITNYEFYTGVPSAKTLVFKIPLFQNKAEFHLGEVINRQMPRMSKLETKSMFQNRPSKLKLIIKEISLDTELVLDESEVDGINIISGFYPKDFFFENTFLDYSKLPSRVTEGGYIFFNIFSSIGGVTIYIHKNDVEVANLAIPVNFSSYTLTKFIKVSDYGAVKGDVIRIGINENPYQTKEFHVFPATPYRNYIAFEDEYKLKTYVECTGEYRFNADFASKINKVKNGLVEKNNKVSSTTDLTLIVNTGFMLQEDELLIERLLSSKKAWLITDNNTGFEIISTTKKLPKLDPTTALYSYDLEFLVNPKDTQPIRAEMNKSFSFIEIDEYAPLPAKNLTVSNLTLTSLTLSWDAASDAYGIGEYVVLDNDIELGVTSNLSIDITGLTPYETYNLTVLAYDLNGNTSSSQVLSVTMNTTLETTPPTPPINLLALYVTTNSLTLFWDAATDNVAILKYKIYKNGIKIAETNALTLTYNVLNLTHNTNYNFYIIATDTSGNDSVASATLSQTTNAYYSYPFLMSSIGYSSVFAAKDAVLDLTSYNMLREGFPDGGDLIYNSSYLPFVGFNKYYKLSNNTFILIDNYGYVTGVGFLA